MNNHDSKSEACGLRNSAFFLCQQQTSMGIAMSKLYYVFFLVLKKAHIFALVPPKISIM